MTSAHGSPELSTNFQRRNHGGGLSWQHLFLSFPGNRRSTLSLGYTFDRAQSDDEEDSWNHAWDAGYTIGLTPRTEVDVGGGYQWIQPEETDDEHAFNYSAGLRHRFSPFTRGNLSYAERWDYEAASSRTDFTQLTRVRRVNGGLSSRLAERVTGSLAGSYLKADTDQEFALGDAEDYWEAVGSGSLSAELGETGFWGLGYSFARRQTDQTDEDYQLHNARTFYRRALGTWLAAEVSYIHERRYYDSASALRDYHENRVMFGLSATL